MKKRTLIAILTVALIVSAVAALGIGAMADYVWVWDSSTGTSTHYYTPWYEYNALITSITLENGVTKIGNVHFIERGYENMLGKLTALGAKIRVIEE